MLLLLLLQGLQPSAESDAARRGVVSDMQALVAEAMDPSYHAAVETFGSFRAGLHLPGETGHGVQCSGFGVMLR